MKLAMLQLTTSVLFAFASLLIAGCGAEVTKAKYDTIHEGMSYEEAVSVIGSKGEDVASSQIDGAPGVKIYSWQNSDGSNMIATFQDGQLIQKAQVGLK